MNMLQSQQQSPMRSLLPNNLTLASLNARQSESPTNLHDTPLLYTSWDVEPSFPFVPPISGTYDFQSNSIYEPPPPPPPPTSNVPASSGLTGLGIHCPPDISSDFRLPYSPKSYPAELGEQYLTFSPRLESTYSMNESGAGFPGLDDLTNGSQDMTALWSLPVPSLSGDNSNPFGVEGLHLPHVPSGSISASGSGDDQLSLESLSAAAGISVDELTAHIAEGAQYALRQLTEIESLSDGTNSASVEPCFDDLPSLGSIPPFLDFLPGDVGPPDMWPFQPCLGINPADVMPAPEVLSAIPAVDNPLSRPLDPTMNLAGHFADFHLPVLFDPEADYTSMLNGISAPTRSSRGLPEPVHVHDEPDAASDYEPPAFLSPSSSEYSPSFGTTRQFPVRSSRIKKRKFAQQNELSQSRPPVASSSSSSKDSSGSHLPPIDLGSPVFDAHRGIELDDLKARAERYRLRNQGREYDKRWLLSFAGKLSSKGELIEEFRCYVVGCQQVNKRRDHILIHVGAHLDQRPFKCMHCCARFLRKNECKRHELSHTGVRPFTCSICPYPGTTFVRQDLLRRHMKRTHQMEDDKENKATGSSFRPRKKVKSI